MPNWMSGTLRIRGNPSDIENFFLCGLGQPAGKYENTPMSELMECFKAKDDYYIDFKTELYIKGTKRAFIDDGCAEFIPNEEITVACVNVKQAWDLKPNEWQEIAKKYNVDLRLWACDSSGHEARELEIIQGCITQFRKVKYKNWEWECPTPKLGG